jgi:sec-independent protein translocase protein TatB
MFDVGMGELVLISIIGLLVLGPQRLPKVAAEIGKWIGRARRTATQLRRQLEREIELSDLETPPQRPAPPQSPPPPAAPQAAAPQPQAAQESAVPSQQPDPPPAQPAEPTQSAAPTATSEQSSNGEALDESAGGKSVAQGLRARERFETTDETHN